MNKYIFTIDSINGVTSVPTVYAQVDSKGVRIYDNFDDESAIKRVLDSLGTGLRSDGEIDWSQVRVEPYSETLGFSTRPLSSLPERSGDSYVLAADARDLFAMPDDFFNSTLAKLPLPAKAKLSEVALTTEEIDSAGFNRLFISASSALQLGKIGATVSGPNLVVRDTSDALAELIKGGSSLESIGGVTVDFSPSQFADIASGNKAALNPKTATSLGSYVHFVVSVEDSDDLSALVANNTSLAEFPEIQIRLGRGLVDSNGPLASGSDSQIAAKTTQLGEYIASIDGGSVSIDPGVLMKLIATGDYDELLPEIDSLKTTAVVSIEASVDRFVELQTPKDVFNYSQDGFPQPYGVTITSPEVIDAMGSFADKIVILSDNNGLSFVTDPNAENAEASGNNLALNPKLIGGWIDQAAGGGIQYNTGALVELFRQVDYAEQEGWGISAPVVELASTSGTLFVNSDLAGAAKVLGFTFSAANEVILDLAGSGSAGGREDLSSRFSTWDWRLNDDGLFSSDEKDGEADSLVDIKALARRYFNWWQVGDYDKNGQEDAWESVFIPDSGNWVNRAEWMLGWDGDWSDYQRYNVWYQTIQDWLNFNDSDDADTELSNLEAAFNNQSWHSSSIADFEDFQAEFVDRMGFVDFDGDGEADLPGLGAAASSLSFEEMRALSATGVDSIRVGDRLVIDLVNDDESVASLKQVVTFLKSTPLKIQTADGSSASIEIDTSGNPRARVTLKLDDVNALASKGISLVNEENFGLITLSETSSTFGESFKNLSVDSAAALFGTGVSYLDIADRRALALSVEQAKALAVSGAVFSATSVVYLVDKAQAINELSSAQISALGSLGVGKIDASDNKEIVFTDRQIRSLLRADIVVNEDDVLRAVLADDYLIRAVDSGDFNEFDFGQIVSDLSAVGVDYISGSNKTLQMTAKMLADASTELSNTNPNGLVAMTAPKKTLDLKKLFAGVEVVYQDDAELGFLPDTVDNLTKMGVIFTKVEQAKYEFADPPTLELAIGQAVTLSAQDFFVEEVKQKKGPPKLVPIENLDLVNDSEIFTISFSVQSDNNDGGGNSVQLQWNTHSSADLIISNWGNYKAYKSWDLAPILLDDGLLWGWDDPSRPALRLIQTEDILRLIESQGQNATFQVTDSNGRSFDVVIDRPQTDYLNNDFQRWNYITDVNGNEAQTDFVVFRVLEDDQFLSLFDGGLDDLRDPNTPWDDLYMPWNEDYGYGSDYTNWASTFFNGLTISGKSFSSDELFDVYLDGEYQVSENGLYEIEITGAQLKAGALSIEAGYGALNEDGTLKISHEKVLDDNGDLVDAIYDFTITGGTKETQSFVFANLDGSSWFQGQGLETFGSNSSAYQLQISWDLDGDGLVDEEFLLDSEGFIDDFWLSRPFNGDWLDVIPNVLDGDSDQDGRLTFEELADSVDLAEFSKALASSTSIDFFLPSWGSFDQWSASWAVAEVLSADWLYEDTWNNYGGQVSYDQNHIIWRLAESGISRDEWDILSKLRETVQFSSPDGVVQAVFNSPGNVSNTFLQFGSASALRLDYLQDFENSQGYLPWFVGYGSVSEVMESFPELSQNVDADGDDIVVSTRNATTSSTYHFSVSNELTVGDVFAFRFGDQTLDVVISAKDVGKTGIDTLFTAFTRSVKESTDFSLFSGRGGITKLKDGDLRLYDLNARSVANGTDYEVSQVSEAGAFSSSVLSKDGSGGSRLVEINVAEFNEAPTISSRSSIADIESKYSNLGISLRGVALDDTSDQIRVAISPERGAYTGSFSFMDLSRVQDFIDAGSLRIYYDDTSGKVTRQIDLKTGRVPDAVSKIYIEAVSDIETQGTIYKAADLITMVLGSIDFELNKSIYTRDFEGLGYINPADDSRYNTVGFDLQVWDDVSVDKKSSAVVIDTSKERALSFEVRHEVVQDSNGDNRIDAQDTVLSVTRLQQVWDGSDGGYVFEAGLYEVSNSSDTNYLNVENGPSAKKVISVNQKLVHDFSELQAEFLTNEGVSSSTDLFLHGEYHADAFNPLTIVDLKSYAQAGFVAYYAEGGGDNLWFEVTPDEFGDLAAYGIQYVGDMVIDLTNEVVTLTDLVDARLLSDWFTKGYQDNMLNGFDEETIKGRDADILLDYLYANPLDNSGPTMEIDLVGFDADDRLDLSFLVNQSKFTAELTIDGVWDGSLEGIASESWDGQTVLAIITQIHDEDNSSLYAVYGTYDSGDLTNGISDFLDASLVVGIQNTFNEVQYDNSSNLIAA